MPDAKVRFALVGFGAWGEHHARALTESAETELVAIAANSPKSQELARAAHPGVKVVDDYRALLEDETIEAVDVVVPTHLHFPIARDVLTAGKHLLQEKPMAPKVEQCRELITLANEEARVLAIGHELRLSSLWGRVKRMIEEGAVGEPHYLLIELWRRPYRQGSAGWRYDPARVGNWILEEPIHFFDLARWYLAKSGEPVAVHASASPRDPDRPGLQENFSATLRFADGAFAVIAQTLAAFEHHQTVKVTGSRGALWASWSGALDRTFEPTFSLKHFDGGTVREVPIESKAGEVYELVAEVSAVARAIRSGQAPPVTGEDGLWSVTLCLQAQESVDSGRVVLL